MKQNLTDNSVRTYHFFSPNKIIMGIGAARKIGEEAKILGSQKAFIIVDKAVTKSAPFGDLKEALLNHKIKLGIFAEIERDVSSRVIHECADIIRKEKYDLVVGVGGGTTLDTTKAAALMALQ